MTTPDPNKIPYTSKEDEKKGFCSLTIDASLLQLFQHDLESQVGSLTQGLIEIEQGIQKPEIFESLMRAAHSIKGAARVIQLVPVVTLAHSLEDCFVAAKKDPSIVAQNNMDLYLQAVDLFALLSKVESSKLQVCMVEQQEVIEELTKKFEAIVKKAPIITQPLMVPQEPKKDEALPSTQEIKEEMPLPTKLTLENLHQSDRILRVTAKNLNRLMGLAGESLIESSWLHPYANSLNKYKQVQDRLTNLVEGLRDNLERLPINDISKNYLNSINHILSESRQELTKKNAELEMFIRRHDTLSERLYQEVIDIRMRPFEDCLEQFPRMVRDLARQLNKRVHLHIIGKSTQVDRDILEKLVEPLTHLLRNAVDHGIETPEERILAGKPPDGNITIEASHRAGMLAITISDDGKGIDFKKLRKTIVAKGLAKDDVVENLSRAELLEFLYLPGFTTRDKVTEISGRGVGLDIVRMMVQDVGGVIRTQSTEGKGITVYLQLPLTLSVLRCLIVDLGGEPYAFPLSRIERALFLDINEVKTIEGRQYFHNGETNIGLISGYQILESDNVITHDKVLPVIILSDRLNFYGVVVDRFVGEKELVVQELDLQLGKIPDISAGAFLENGDPLLIVDVDDLVRSVDKLLSQGKMKTLAPEQTQSDKQMKKILVVDDSITVREVESRLLSNAGYYVETAVNGVDGWNAVRIRNFDLVITDIDMPRMNGIELVKAIKGDSRLSSMPVMIVSYKDREEDRKQGLDAGANYYLTKSSFHDETLLKIVKDLIGDPA